LRELAVLGVGLLWLGGCAMTAPIETAAPAAATGQVAPIGKTEAKPDGGAAFFEVQERDDLFFQISSLGSWATVTASYDGSGVLSRDQRLQLSGQVTDPTGTKAFAITRVELDAMRDEYGRNILAAGQVSLSPSPRAPGYFSAPSPGSARAMSFGATVQGLPNLPSALSVVKGRVVVEAPAESQTFDLAGIISEGMVDLAPGIAARVRTYPHHREDMLAAQVEYRLTRPDGKDGAWALPMVVGLTLYDQKGEVIFQQQRGSEHVSKNKVMGVIPMNYGLGERRAVRWELEVAVDMREIVFEFEGGNVALAGQQGWWKQ
jgi:hypothetical protein